MKNTFVIVVYLTIPQIIAQYDSYSRTSPFNNNPNLNSVHHCVHATRKLAKRGDGSTYVSCLACEPATPLCTVGCQKMIDYMYLVCDGMCLPDGYFFDASGKLSGCWKDVKETIKIDVQRCGCSDAFSLAKSQLPLIFLTTITLVLLLTM